ncbi:MAG: zf-TFIIB domain-containing protein [Cyanobacteria bacterium P01_F01_bin.56]
MVQCPKELKVELSDVILPDELPAKCCPECGGAWIRPENYVEWQAQRGIDRDAAPYVAVLPTQAKIDFQPVSLDNRAALCPDCKNYLVRGRVQLPEVMFFVERCPNCHGYWCDRGEWEVLQQLQLDQHLEYIFSDQWQSQIKALDFAVREKAATIDKLGPEIAEKVFELAQLLEAHPEGDFGVAYLMRRFEE